MTESRGDENRGFVLRVSVRYRDEGSGEERQKDILALTRSEDGKACEVSLPEADDVVGTGWVPEIVCRQGEVEIVIRPDLARFQRGESGGAKEEGAREGESGVRAAGVSERAVEADVKAEAEGGAGALDGAAPGRETAARVAGGAAADERELCGAVAASRHKEGDDILYRVTFVGREVRVNGFRLSRPNFNSENEIVFDYLFRNPNRRIDIGEIEDGTKRPLTKKLREIVRDLGFVRELRDLFFPDISKTSIRFVNPVTRANYERRELRAPGIRVG